MSFITPGGLNKRVRGLYLFEALESAAPPITLLAATSDSSDIGITEWTTPNSGAFAAAENRFLFAGIAALNAFGGSPVIAGCFYDGATPVPALAAAQSIYAGNGSVQIFGVAPGPAAAFSIRGTWDNAFQSSLGGAVFSNVNQVTPILDIDTNSGAFVGASGVGSVVIANCQAGVPVVAWFGASNDNVNGIDFDDLNDSVVVTASGVATDSLLSGGAVVMVTPAADGPCIVETTIINPGAGQITWRGFGGRLVQA